MIGADLQALGATLGLRIEAPCRAQRWQSSLVVLLFAFLLRYCVSTFGYSGMGNPPMYGDFEAQRHWMEVTVNLPLSQWYHNTPDNDLLYWGLDYPPLTAYVSCLFGYMALLVEPDLVELHKSRGFETPSSKLFMRGTVLCCDFLVFAPAIFMFTVDKSTNARLWAALLILTQPAFVLIDHGHFQYNCVALGLSLFAFCLVMSPQAPSAFWPSRSMLVGCSLFIAAMAFKQMSLYFSPALFFYLLGRAHAESTWKARWLVWLILLGSFTIFNMLLWFLPFFPSGIMQVLHRIFPVSRGLFEDKVASFWCVSNVLVKWHKFEMNKLVLASISLTALGFLPGGVALLRYPTPNRFLCHLGISSLAFFLFSVQVHEKSILFPLLPICLLCFNNPLLVVWAGLVSAFSMFPLLLRDQLLIPYIACQVLFLVFSVAIHYSSPASFHASGLKMPLRVGALFQVSIAGGLLIHLFHVFVTPPPRLKDLAALLYAAYSFIHFAIAFLLLNFYLLSDGYPRHKRRNFSKSD
eukprot:g8947.t1